MRQLYYWLIKNQDVTDIINNFSLPLADNQIFTNGFLQYQFLTDEELKDINNKIKYQQSIYGKNEIVIETGDDDTNKEIDFDLRQPGLYEIELTGAGGGCQISKNFLSDQKFICFINTQGSQLDLIYFYNNYTWVRYLEDENDTISRNGYFQKIWGTYKLTDNYIELKSEWRNTVYEFINTAGVNNFYNNYEMPDNIILPNLQFKFRKGHSKNINGDGEIKGSIDDEKYEIENYGNSILSFKQKTDINLTKFRMITFNSKEISGVYKIYLFNSTYNKNERITDSSFRSYYKIPQWSFNQYDQESDNPHTPDHYKYLEKILTYDNSTDILQELKNWTTYGTENPLSNPSKPLTTGHKGTWIIKHFVNNIKAITSSPGGDGGCFHSYFKLEKCTLTYGIGKAGIRQERNSLDDNYLPEMVFPTTELSAGQGSFLKINPITNQPYYGKFQILWAAGGNADQRYGGFNTNENNNNMVKNGKPEGNNSSFIEYDINNNLEKPRSSDTSKTLDFVDNNKSSYISEYDRKIGLSLTEKNIYVEKHGKSLQSHKKDTNDNYASNYYSGLGGLGAGVIHDETGLNFYRKSQSGKLKIKFLALKSTLCETSEIIIKDSAILSASIDQQITVPAGTLVEFKVMLGDQTKELGLGNKIEQLYTYDKNNNTDQCLVWYYEKTNDYLDDKITQEDIDKGSYSQDKLGAPKWEKCEKKVINQTNIDSKVLSFVITRLTHNIQQISFVTLQSPIRLELRTTDRQYKILWEENDNLQKVTASSNKKIITNFDIEGFKRFDKVTNNEIITLTFKMDRVDITIDRDLFIKRNGLYEIDEQEVKWEYDQKSMIDKVSFKMPPHDIVVPTIISNIYQLVIQPANIVTCLANSAINRKELREGKISSLEWGYNKDQLFPRTTMIKAEVVPGQLIFVKVTLNKRIRIDTVTTVFPSGTIVEKEGVNINSIPLEGDSLLQTQWFSFRMPDASVQIDLYCELRTYKLKIRQDKYGKISIIPESGIYDYEPNDISSIQFDLPNYFKLTNNSGALINGTQYDLLSTDKQLEFNEQLGIYNQSSSSTQPVVNDKIKRSVQQFYAYFKTNGRAFTTKSKFIDFGYYSDIYEDQRQLMLRSEIVRFSIVFKNSDLEVYIEPEYLANSTLLNAGEDEQGSFQLVHPGLFRLIVAGCKSGNGGHGGDGGPRPRVDENFWTKSPASKVAGKAGGVGGSGFIGGNGGKATDAAEARLAIKRWGGFLPYQGTLNNFDGGGGGLGGDGFFQAGKGGMHGNGSLWKDSGYTGADGTYYVKYKGVDVGNDMEAKGIFNKDECSVWRGFYLDCLIYITKENVLYYDVGTSGKDGANAPPTPFLFHGQGGAGGGAGGPACIFFNDIKYIILKYNPVFNENSIRCYTNSPGVNSEESMTVNTSPSPLYYVSPGGRPGNMVISAGNSQNSPIGGYRDPYSDLSAVRRHAIMAACFSQFQIIKSFATQSLDTKLGGGGGNYPKATDGPGTWASFGAPTTYDIQSIGLLRQDISQWGEFTTKNLMPIGGKRGKFPNMLKSMFVNEKLIDNVKIAKEYVLIKEEQKRDDWYDKIGYYIGQDHVPNDSGGIRLIFLSKKPTDNSPYKYLPTNNNTITIPIKYDDLTTLNFSTYFNENMPANN